MLRAGGARLNRVREILPLTWTLQDVRGTSSRLLKQDVLESGPTVQVELPFSSDSEFRAAYSLFGTDKIRVGLILEDLDGLAADIGMRHMRSMPNVDAVTLMTASFDRLSLRSWPLLTHDLVLRGQVSYVGRTSLAVEIDISAKNGTQFGTAEVVMVALEKSTHKATPVPPLEASAAAKDRHEARSARREALGKPLTEQEVESVYAAAARCEPWAPPTRLAAGEVWMHDTLQSTVRLVHHQERNMNGHMFGGVLLRLALEQAHTTMRLFSGTHLPELLEMLDVSFVRPVPVSANLCVRGAVLETTSDDLWVGIEIVTVSGTVQGGHSFEKCADFHFRFRVAGDCPQIVPFSYQDALKLARHRRRCLDWR